MSEISVWSIVPAQNGTRGAPPIYWPEGQAPSTVNNCARQMMAALRVQMQDAQWFNWGYTTSRISGVKFDMNIGTASATTSVVANFVANRRIKVYSTSTIYATISEASLSGSLINITVTPDSGSLVSTVSSAYLSILTPANTSIPSTVSTAGGLQSIQVLTTGSAATYTTPAGVTRLVVQLVGGGGGGGGADAAVANQAAGGGGAGGGYCSKLITSAAATYTYTVGTGGAGGATGLNAGSTGVTTSFGALSATGGSGGAAGTTSAIASGAALSGAGGTGGGGAGGDININGDNGLYGVGYGANFAAGGAGAPSGGGLGMSTPSNSTGTGAAANGSPGGIYGAGGAGGSSLNTASTASGGAGADGVIIVYEYS